LKYAEVTEALCYVAELSSISCEAGWTVNPVKETCIKLWPSSGNRDAAVFNCQSVEASLLMLNTEEVYEWYQTLVASDPCECIRYTIRLLLAPTHLQIVNKLH